MTDFSSKTNTELSNLLEEKREQLREIRFAISGAGDTSPHEKRQLKKDVARILTELRERQLA